MLMKSSSHNIFIERLNYDVIILIKDNEIIYINMKIFIALYNLM